MFDLLRRSIHSVVAAVISLVFFSFHNMFVFMDTAIYYTIHASMLIMLIGGLVVDFVDYVMYYYNVINYLYKHKLYNNIN